VRDLLAVSAARVAGGIAILGCVAAIALAVGGPGVFGGLGSLLGRDGASLEIAKHTPSAADIVAAPTAADRAAALRSLTRPRRRDAGSGSPRSRSRAPSSPAPRAPSSGPTPAIPPLAPGPSPSPSPPPPPAAPSPGSGQVVATLGEAVKQVTSQAPPAAEPLTKPLNDAIDTLVQACRGLPACP
jgi:hypothetical protein